MPAIDKHTRKDIKVFAKLIPADMRKKVKCGLGARTDKSLRKAIGDYIETKGADGWQTIRKTLLDTPAEYVAKIPLFDKYFNAPKPVIIVEPAYVEPAFMAPLREICKPNHVMSRYVRYWFRSHGSSKQRAIMEAYEFYNSVFWPLHNELECLSASLPYNGKIIYDEGLGNISRAIVVIALRLKENNRVEVARTIGIDPTDKAMLDIIHLGYVKYGPQRFWGIIDTVAEKFTVDLSHPRIDALRNRESSTTDEIFITWVALTYLPYK